VSGRVIHRLYVDFEKEERWLNEMAATGLDLVRYSWGTYHFEEGAPGEWIYRIELLPKDPRKPASKDYLDFMAAAGVQTVTTYMSWVYFRRPAAEGPFQLFSDLDSRISHYRRVLTLFGCLLVALVPTAVFVLASADQGLVPFVFPLAIVELALGAVLALQTVKLTRRVSSLKAQKQLYE
jgi:hypothetical protein